MTTLREALLLVKDPGAMAEPLRVRVSSSTLADLNRIEAMARGAGMRDVNRSSLVRAALEDYIARVAATQIEEN